MDCLNDHTKENQIHAVLQEHLTNVHRKQRRVILITNDYAVTDPDKVHPNLRRKIIHQNANIEHIIYI